MEQNEAAEQNQQSTYPQIVCMIKRPPNRIVLPNKKPILIGLGNKSRVGKDALADYIIGKYANFELVRFAQPLYDIASSTQQILGKPIKKDPTLMQQTGDTMRKVYSDGIFVDVAMAKIQLALANGKNVVVVDVRRKNEYNALVSAGFVYVRINRPDRPIDRDPNHISETDLDNVDCDYIIDNVGSEAELYNIGDQLVHDIVKKQSSS